MPPINPVTPAAASSTPAVVPNDCRAETALVPAGDSVVTDFTAGRRFAEGPTLRPEGSAAAAPGASTVRVNPSVGERTFATNDEKQRLLRTLLGTETGATGPVTPELRTALNTLFQGERGNLDRIYGTRGVLSFNSLGAATYRSADEYKTALDIAEGRVRSATTVAEVRQAISGLPDARKRVDAWERVGADSNALGQMVFQLGLSALPNEAAAALDVAQGGSALLNGEYGSAGSHVAMAAASFIPLGRMAGTAVHAVRAGGIGLEAAETLARFADHPAFEDIVQRWGPRFTEAGVSAGIRGMADASTLEHIAANLKRIESGDVAGTTLARYGGNPNGYLEDVAEKFHVKNRDHLGAIKPLGLNDIADLSPSVYDVLKRNPSLVGSRGRFENVASLEEPLTRLLKSPAVTTADLGSIQRLANVLTDMNPGLAEVATSVVRDAINGKTPGEAMRAISTVSQKLEKLHAGRIGPRGNVKELLVGLGAADTGLSMEAHRALLEGVLDPRVSMTTADRLMQPEALSAFIAKYGEAKPLDIKNALFVASATGRPF